MGKRLPYFPFYALDWITDPQVQGLSNEQRGIFHWLLCRQWLDGDLPEEPILVYPLLPPSSDSNAVVYILDTFFPIVGGGKRRNRRLSDIRDELDAKHAAKAGGADKARKAKSAKYRATKQLPISDISPDIKGRIKTQNQIQTTEEAEQHSVGLPSVLPPEVGAALQPFLKGDATQRRARIGEVQMLLEGMRGPAVAPDAVARGLSDMAATGATFTPVAVKRFAQRAVGLLEGEAGARAAHEALKPISPVLRQPSANQMPSGWAEDEVDS